MDRLQGLAEWRNLELVVHNDIHTHNKNNNEEKESAGGLLYNASLSSSSSSSNFLRPVTILQREAKEVVLPGEEKYLQFVGEYEANLFQTALDKHHGIFGIGLLLDDDDDDDDDEPKRELQRRKDDNDNSAWMYSTIPLLEIEESLTIPGRSELGIFCKARVVGRGKVHQVFSVPEQPFQATVYEAKDDFEQNDIIRANQAASGVELLIKAISYHPSSKRWGDDEDERRRIDRFLEAYEASLDSDQQTYRILSTDLNIEQRSWRELRAISWAAYAIDDEPNHEDIHVRLAALHHDDISERLDAARRWLTGVGNAILSDSAQSS